MLYSSVLLNINFKRCEKLHLRTSMRSDHVRHSFCCWSVGPLSKTSGNTDLCISVENSYWSNGVWIRPLLLILKGSSDFPYWFLSRCCYWGCCICLLTAGSRDLRGSVRGGNGVSVAELSATRMERWVSGKGPCAAPGYRWSVCAKGGRRCAAHLCRFTFEFFCGVPKMVCSGVSPSCFVTEELRCCHAESDGCLGWHLFCGH